MQQGRTAIAVVRSEGTSTSFRFDLLWDAGRHIRDCLLRQYKLPGMDVLVGSQLDICFGTFSPSAVCFLRFNYKRRAIAAAILYPSLDLLLASSIFQIRLVLLNLNVSNSVSG